MSTLLDTQTDLRVRQLISRVYALEAGGVGGGTPGPAGPAGPPGPGGALLVFEQPTTPATTTIGAVWIKR